MKIDLLLYLLVLCQRLASLQKRYSAQQLAPIEPLLSTKSAYIYNTVGVYGVAESAALFAAQNITDTALKQNQKCQSHRCASERVSKQCLALYADVVV